MEETKYSEGVTLLNRNGLILLLIPALESSYVTHCLPLGFATLLLWHSLEEALLHSKEMVRDAVSSFMKGHFPFSNGTAVRSTQERKCSLLKAAVGQEEQEACRHCIIPKRQQLIW